MVRYTLAGATTLAFALPFGVAPAVNAQGADLARWGAPVALYSAVPLAKSDSVDLTRAAGAADMAASQPGRVVDWRAIAGQNEASREPAAQPARGGMSEARAVTAATAPKPGGVRKVGRPYEVNGIWYVPAEQPSYDEVGEASWYGSDFHGKTTANGEIYDMYAMTAAHTTLPMPSLVRVTNLENGRSVVVRLNDRGPFASERIIDLSKAAAQKLDFVNQGTVQVRVQYVGPADAEFSTPATREAQNVSAPTPQPRIQRTGAQQALPTTPPQAVNARGLVAAPGFDRDAVLNPNGTLRHGVALSRPMIAPSGIFVQVGAFTEEARAEQVRDAIAGPSFVQRAYVNEQRFHRVMVGPWPNEAAARDAQGVIAGMGFGDPIIVHSN